MSFDKNTYVPHFEHYTSAEQYENVALKGYAPMTAKEIDTEEQQDALLSDREYVVEEKFDGTRALLYFLTPRPVKFGHDHDSLLKYVLTRGSGFEGGKKRIYEYLISHERKECVDFLKKEYGTGGSFLSFPDNTSGWLDYSPKNLCIRDGKIDNLYSWNGVAKALLEMIAAGEFYPQSAYTRCFSRRVSEKTGWYCENTDSLPQLRGLNVPELAGTIIDGEMFIPDRPFKDVSATLNCKWDKAIDRQLELGYVVFHAFDILFYKGIDLRKMPLKRRKVYLDLVIKKANTPYIENVKTYSCGSYMSEFSLTEKLGRGVECIPLMKERIKDERKYSIFVMNLCNVWRDTYPNLYRAFAGNSLMTPRAYYELIVATGGEGVMIKPVDGKYYHKRGREYQKIKKFLTREAIIMGFEEPTDDYKGKFPTIEKWDYWETNEGDRVDLSTMNPKERENFKQSWYPDMCRPISKFYCYNWVGTIRFGVTITPEEMAKLQKNKKFNIEELILEGDDVLVLEVGECSGFDEETRKMFSENPKQWVGGVIEVKANEIFRDTGKLRHPRFLRVRADKSPVECTYADHISV